MSRRARPSLEWEAMPLLRPAARRHGHATHIVAAAFALGLLIGLAF